MGIKLIFVIEGNRRIRFQNENEKLSQLDNNDNARSSFHLVNRRSGTLFWKACTSCEQILKLLGVDVVRAEAEGEALCALLNSRGIVDGVITNDGDTLLYGASVIYTNFSIENLDSTKIIRYELSKLRGRR